MIMIELEALNWSFQLLFYIYDIISGMSRADVKNIQLFGDNTYADACLSRMTSKAYRLDFPGRDRRVESK